MAKHHVNIPKSTLLRFGKSGLINYLNTMTLEIKQSTAASFNTSENHFPDNAERDFNIQCEGILAKFYSKYNNFMIGKLEKITISNNDREKVIDCIIAQFCRNNTSAAILQENSIASLITKQSLGSCSTFLYYESSMRNFIRDLYRGFEANVLLNFSESEFVIPSLHYYEAPHDGIISTIFVLSPKIAILFAPSESRAKHIDNGVLSYARIGHNDNATVQNLNIICFDQENRIGAKFIVGKKDELERIKARVQSGLNNGTEGR